MENGGRFTDPGVLPWDLLDEIHVVCPGCGGPALVMPRGPVFDRHRPRAFDDRRLTCSGCALVRAWPGRGKRTLTWREDGCDPYFGEPLLARTACGGHMLWAFNPRHLDIIERFVSATDRQRPPVEPGGATVVEHLPGWIKSAGNRRAVLVACQRLASFFGAG